MKKLTVGLAMLSVLSANIAFAEYDEFKPIVVNLIRQKIPVNTKETIKLKNIEFKGDAKNKFIEMCKQENSTQRCYEGIYKDSKTLRDVCLKVKSESDACQIKNDGMVLMGDFTYGSLTLNRKQAWSNINDKGELLYFHQNSRPENFPEMIELLKEKYGKPTVVNDNDVRDRNYKTLKRQQTYWKDANGTVLAIDNITESSVTGNYVFNTGEINIMSKDFIDKVVESISNEVKAEEKRKMDILNKL